MADWDGLRRDLEHGVTPPPLTALRERRRRRQQRRTIAVTCAVAMVGTASGVALLGRAAQQADPRRPVAAPPTDLTKIVNGAPLPPPRDYREHVVTDVDFVSPSVGWAIGLRCVGETCDVASWRTADGGRTWSAPADVATGVPRASFHEEDPAGGAVRSLRMVDESRGYAFNPDLYVTTDGGRTWRRDPRPTKVASVSLVGDTVWVTERGCAREVDCDVVVRSGSVGGPLATTVDVPETNGAAGLVRRVDARTAYLLTWAAPDPRDNALRRTTDGGRTWRPVRHPCADADAVSLSAAAGRPLWVVCSAPGGRRVLVSADGGTSWRRAGDAPADGEVTDLLATSATRAYLATQTPGRVLVTDDGGATWRPADGVAKAYGYANLDLTMGTLWAMGDAGHLWRAAGGTRWERLALPPGAPRAAAAPAPPSPSAPADRGVTFTGLSFVDERLGYALGHRCDTRACRAVLRRTRDGGVSWEAVTAPAGTWPVDDAVMPRNRVTDVAFADERTGWLFGQNVFVTRDGGATWTEAGSGYVYDVVPRDGTVWSVAYEGCASNPCGAMILRGQVADARPEPVEGRYRTGHLRGWFAAADAGHAYFADAGTAEPGAPAPVVVGTADGGRTWSRYRAPCRRAWTRALSAYGPGGLWALCAGLPDGTQWLATSADGGATWRTTRLPGRGVDVGILRALSPTYGWRSGANAGLLVTHDGGATWEAATGVPARMVALTFAGERHGWALDDEGYVWRTTDGASWARIVRP